MSTKFPDNYFFPAFVEHYGNAYFVTCESVDFFLNSSIMKIQLSGLAAHN